MVLELKNKYHRLLRKKPKMRMEIGFNICRICLQNSDEEMSSMYESMSTENDGDTEELLYQKIERCGGIQVLTYPELPNKICKKCNIFLNIAHKFRTMCWCSDRYLRKFMSRSSKQLRKQAYIMEDNDTDEVVEYLSDFNQGDANSTVEQEVQPTGYEIITDGFVEYFSDFNPEDDNSNAEQVWQQADYEMSADGVAECVSDFNPEAAYSTVEQVLQQTDHEIDESQTEFYSDEIVEMWLNDNEMNAQAAQERKPDFNANSPTVVSLDVKPLEVENIRRSDRKRKTLDITSDGAAVIRVKSPRSIEPEKKNHMCHICGNSYNRISILETHMRRHRNERPYECEICHKAFALNYELIYHIRKHSGARPFTCEYCKKTFVDRSAMVRHQRIHRNERPFTCEVCNKSFTYKNVLKMHRLTHTGEKPYSCRICEKRFARADQLRAHLETLQHRNDPRSKMLIKQIAREDVSCHEEE